MPLRPRLPGHPFRLLTGLAALISGVGASGAATAQEPPAEVEWSGGSALACAVPLRWYVADVDGRFDLPREEAEDAVRLAGMLWEEAAGRILFRHDAEEGFPVRFVYDGRQEAARARARRQAELDAIAAEVQELRLGIETLHREVDEARARLQRREAEYRRRLEAHRARIERWNERGGAPPEERERLEEEARELDRQRVELEREAEALNRRVDEANRETRELNRRVAEYNREQARFAAAVPAELVQSGVYRESRRRLGSRILSVEREILVHHFEDRTHLTLVLAHELGHALGLGHSGVPGSVMIDAAGPRDIDGSPRLTSADVQMLRDRCPDL